MFRARNNLGDYTPHSGQNDCIGFTQKFIPHKGTQFINFLDFKPFISCRHISLNPYNTKNRMKWTVTKHKKVHITHWKMNNILLGLYLKPPMKGVPCLPFSWILEVVNFLSNRIERVSWETNLLSLRLILFGVCGVFWCWLFLVVIWCHCWNWARWRQIKIIFLPGDGIFGWTSNSSLCMKPYFSMYMLLNF